LQLSVYLASCAPTPTLTDRHITCVGSAASAVRPQYQQSIPLVIHTPLPQFILDASGRCSPHHHVQQKPAAAATQFGPGHDDHKRSKSCQSWQPLPPIPIEKPSAAPIDWALFVQYATNTHLTTIAFCIGILTL
jgi:hypothetical protein